MITRFGPFELDDKKFELRRNGQQLPAPRRVFDTIRFLVENRHRVVTKADLKSGPWGGAAVSDAALARSVMLARRVLGDDPRNPQLIVTVRGRGFRLICPGTESRNSKSSPPASRPRAIVATSAAAAFFGRASELAALQKAWSTASDGRGSLLFVTGEPGIGKTSLVERFANAHVPPAAAFWGRSWEAGGAPSFWPWPEALRGVCDSLRRPTLRALTRGIAADLARIVPELRALVSRERVFDPIDETPDARFRVFDSVSSFLRKAASQNPILIVLEDLHAADDTALSLLSFIAPSVGQARLLIVGTCRAPDFEERPALRAIVRATNATVASVALEGLSEDEVATWLEQSAPTGVGGIRSAATQTHRLTNGHPFLVQDLLRTFGTTDLIEHTERAHLQALRVPDSLGSSFRKRLSRLPAETRNALERAAVTGREFPVSIRNTTSADGVTGGLQILLPAIDEGLVLPSARRSGWFRFAHDLIRKTLYGDLAAPERLALHSQIATGLIAEAPDRDMFEIANHLLIAAPAHGLGPAVTWSLRAMEQADRQFAHEVTIEYGNRALELLESCGDPECKAGDVLLALGRAQRLAGLVEEADAAFRRCFNWSAEHDKATPLALSALCRLDLLRERATVDEELREQVRVALERIAEPGALRAQLLAAKGVAEFFRLSAEQAREVFQEALRMARATGDPEALMTVSAAIVITARYTFGLVETLLATDELMTAARRTRRFDRLMEALLRRASCFIESGDGFRFRTTQAEHRRIAHQLRYPIELWHSSLLEATTLLLEGDFARAESVARDSGARAAPQLGVSARAFLGAQLISFALEQHPKTAWARFQEALVVGRELLGLAPTYQGWIVGTAMIELELGNPRAAMNLLKHLRECGLGAILTDVNRFLCLVHLARIAWRLGDLDFASNLVQVLEPLAGSHAGNWGIYFGPISYYSGKLHLSLEQKARAIDCFEHAAIDSDRIGSRPWRAWSEHGLAEALALDPRKQDVERQNVLLESVRTQANALNMGRLLYELDRPGGVAARFK